MLSCQLSSSSTVQWHTIVQLEFNSSSACKKDKEGNLKIIFLWCEQSVCSPLCHDTLEIDSADSTRATGRWVTRIWLLHTSLRLTNKSTTTVGVNDTFRFAARDGIRVRNQTRLTPTDGITRPGHWALGTRTTGWRITWVRLLHTPLTLTNKTSLTIWISDTFWLTSWDCVWVWDQTRLTSADGIASASDWTLSTWSTRVGVTWIWLDNTSLTLTNVTLLTIWVSDTLRSTSWYKSRISTLDITL